MRSTRVLVSLVAALSTITAACSGAADDTTASTTPDPTSTAMSVPDDDPPTASTTTTTATSAPSTIAPPTTTPATTAAPTSPPTLPPTDACDEGDILPVVDDTLERARLTAGTPWEPVDVTNPFAERTNSAEEFADRLAFDCATLVQQQNADGDERLALVAWNDVRHAYVVQATDAPATPFRPDATFQLFLDQPTGEWIENQYVWAGTMSGGETVIVGTDDYSAAVTAKSWQSAVPPFDDLPVTLDAERHAIDVLVEAGARNVSVAEPAPVGWPIGSIQLNTPEALVIFATVGPAEVYDPLVPIVDEETALHTHGGIEIRASRGLELDSELIDVGWVCGGHGWRFTTGLGSEEEVLAFATQVIDTDDC